MDILTLANLIAYTAQIAALVALATALAWALRIDTPSVRYAYWRGLIALCLLLPWVQGRAISSVASSVTATPAGGEAVLAASASAGAAQASSWPMAIGLVLLLGIAVRVIWMAASLAHLRRLRTTGDPATFSVDQDELQRLIGASAEIRYVDALRQPVTFGAVRPVVLLPTALGALRPAALRT